jgi:phosphoribosylpyrophosphate synthetase
MSAVLLSPAEIHELSIVSVATTTGWRVLGKGSVMELALFAGSGNPPLAAAIASALGVPLGQRRLARSPDGELRVEIQDNVRARDVFLVQPTGPPLDHNLMELLFLADACRRAGANQVTAVVPYFGYHGRIAARVASTRSGHG